MNTALKTLLAVACLSVATGAWSNDKFTTGKQIVTTGRFEIHEPIDAVFPLFDPINETKWSPDFQITPVYPQPFKVATDATFTTQHNGSDTTWLINAFDPIDHKIEYLVFKTGLLLMRISIDCVAVDNTITAVSVTYRVTGLSEDGNQHASHFDQDFINQWPPALEAYFASQAKVTK